MTSTNRSKCHAVHAIMHGVLTGFRSSEKGMKRTDEGRSKEKSQYFRRLVQDTGKVLKTCSVVVPLENITLG